MLISMLTSAVMGIKLFNSLIKSIKQTSSKTLQLAKCVNKDVNFHVNKWSYEYQTFQFHQLS